MAPTPAPYTIEWEPEAEAEVDALRSFDARSILAAVRELSHQAEQETRNRKPLGEPVDGLPEGSWEIRVGEHRVFYEVLPGDPGAPSGSTSPKIAHVLRVILKGRQTTQEAVSKNS